MKIYAAARLSNVDHVRAVLENMDANPSALRQLVRKRCEASDTSKNFAWVPNLVRADIEKLDNGYQISVVTSEKVSPSLKVRMSNTVFYAAKHLGMRVREFGSKEFKGRFIYDFIMRKNNEVSAYDNRWANKVERDQKVKHSGTPPPVENNNEPLMTMQPTALAQELKNRYKDDFKAAMGAISFYMNRKGKKMLSPDKDRLEKAKEALRKAYGKDTPETKPATKPVGVKPPKKPIGAK